MGVLRFSRDFVVGATGPGTVIVMEFGIENAYFDFDVDDYAVDGYGYDGDCFDVGGGDDWYDDVGGDAFGGMVGYRCPGTWASRTNAF